MNSAEFGRTASVCELNSGTAEGCASMCGVCAPCVFAPKPPGFTQCSWKVSDEFKRRFVLELLLRCRNLPVLANIQNVLGVTSWTWFTYARSRSPGSPQHNPNRSAERAPDGKPLGTNMNKIWDWFSSSPDWIQSRYLCRILSRCDPELLRMVSNLSSVLLIRHKRRFLQFNGKTTEKYIYNKTYMTYYILNLFYSCSNNQHDQDNEDSEDPALMVVPGSSKSVSGVSRYRDFISCLPVDLSKRILGKSIHSVDNTNEILNLLLRPSVGIPAEFIDSSCISVVLFTYAVPFEAAYTKVKTKTVQMEERNVYCGAYFTKVLEDSHRVVDYRGRTLMATGSKDRVVHLFYVASETKLVSVLKGHVASIRAVLLCEDRNLVITASGDASIRCWNLKTDRCEMALYGHTGSVNCLDVHADRLVSGAKDCLVKVWNLNTGKHFEDLNFKHPASIQCVKISTTNVYSSCDRGFVKIWDMEKASLVRVIDGHRCSVKCLFLDEWHLLSGDINGQVMAWSINYRAKECLITFDHPKEVKSLTLVYLRVVTGCVDGIIRIFNFLTGDCLRDITAESETGPLIFCPFSILVNTTSSVKLYQFAKVFWDYTDSAERGQGDVAHNSLTAEKAGTSHRNQRELTCFTVPASCPVPLNLKHKVNHAHVYVTEIFQDQICPVVTFLSFTATDHYEPDQQSLMLSEKATSERIKKRGLHHPLTRDSILLRVNAIQRARCTDEVSINMEWNARLRDSWGPHTLQEPLHADLQPLKHKLHICPLWHSHDDHPRRAKSCVPTVKTVSQNITNTLGKRPVTTAPDTMRRCRLCSCSKTAQPQNVSTYTVTHCVKTGTNLPTINTFRPVQRAARVQAGHRSSV
uniref:Uncharacterized protein n=1 Tax=Anabas testudineus TaxID=64144 RepID=A0A3Q1HJ97_ANATE